MSRPATPSAPSVGLTVAVCVCVATGLLVAFTGGLIVGAHRACDPAGRYDSPTAQRRAQLSLRGEGSISEGKKRRPQERLHALAAAAGGKWCPNGAPTDGTQAVF